MQAINQVVQLRQIVKEQGSGTLGFVPTMGNLHAGHISLVKLAKQQCDCVVVSIFVNRKQFNQKDDFQHYPRTLAADKNKLQQAGADIVFYPDEDQVYPAGVEQSTAVNEPVLTGVLCGASRQGHFEGVTTVVSKLLNMVQPDKLYLGEKDYQQYLVIRKMVADLFFPCDVIAVSTCREKDGLAMSSRNHYLSASERQKAPVLYRTLVHLAEQLMSNSGTFDRLIADAKATLQAQGFMVDYLECRHNTTLQLWQAGEPLNDYRLFVAAFLGTARLIDNIPLTHQK